MPGRLVKSQRVVVNPVTVTVGPGAVVGLDASGPMPTIRLRREGDLVAAIEVGCPCGRHLEFECLYDAGAATPAPGSATIPGSTP